MLKAIEPFKTTIHFKWISAIDGNKIKESEEKILFDKDKYNNNHLWNITKTEIGCVLSHRKCYEELLKTDSNYALILEDDAEFNYDIIPLLPFIDKFMNRDNPRILLLSGWFWYYKKKKINNNLNVCKIYDGRFSHSYLINRRAIEKIFSSKPWYVADDWGKVRSLGIEIYGFSPHFIEQTKKKHFKSSIQDNKKKPLEFSLQKLLKIKFPGILRRFLKLIGNVEKY